MASDATDCRAATLGPESHANWETLCGEALHIVCVSHGTMSVVHMHCKLQVCIPVDAHVCFGAMLVVGTSTVRACLLLQVRRGEWKQQSAVFKLWDLGDSIDSIACMHAEVAVYKLLAALQVRAML